jgi:hypothetical protein
MPVRMVCAPRSGGLEQMVRDARLDDRDTGDIDDPEPALARCSIGHAGNATMQSLHPRARTLRLSRLRDGHAPFGRCQESALKRAPARRSSPRQRRRFRVHTTDRHAIGRER